MAETQADDLRYYAQAVSKMRAVQTQYFKLRLPEDLKESIRLERQVDEWTDEILFPKRSLFAKENHP